MEQTERTITPVSHTLLDTRLFCQSPALQGSEAHLLIQTRRAKKLQV
jgi:hypothetical protein